MSAKKKKYVAVAGTIGAGKTSLVAWLEKRYGLVPFYEPNEGNPYLADFYADMKAWAFHSQAFFLAHKLELHQALERSQVPAVIDRTIYEDAEIFARTLHDQGSMTDVDYENYTSLFHCMVDFLRKPDVILYLRARPETLMDRISRRGRASEKAISLDYIQRLNAAYDDWMVRARGYTDVIEIDTDSVPLQGETPAFRELVERLKRRYPPQAELPLQG